MTDQPNRERPDESNELNPAADETIPAGVGPGGEHVVGFGPEDEREDESGDAATDGRIDIIEGQVGTKTLRESELEGETRN